MIREQAPLGALGELSGLRAAAARGDPQSIDAVARRFEGLFAEMLVASMRDAGFGDPLFAGQSSLFRELYDRELAQRLTAGDGLGIADLLRRQLSAAPPAATGTSSAAPSLRGVDAAAATRDAAFVPGSGAGAKGAPRVVAETERAATLAAAARASATPASPAPAAAEPVPASKPAGATRAAAAPVPTPDEFVARLWPHAERAGRELGVDPRMLVAQAALETGWGRHVMRADHGGSSHNVFGIKASAGWPGARATHATFEYRAGHLTRERAQFRAYDDVGASFADYVRLIRNDPRYREALAVAGDSARYAEALQRAGYATDPQYAAKLKAISQGPTLERALGRLAEPALGEGSRPLWAAR